jgi:hypothetical protein
MGGKLIVYAAEEEEYFTFISPANCTELSASRKEKTLWYMRYMEKASAVYGKSQCGIWKSQCGIWKKPVRYMETNYPINTR